MSAVSEASVDADGALVDGARDDAPTNVLVVGVGGQGVVMMSKVLAQICHQHDFEVKQSEVHGMAKRGGVVFSHVRFGSRVHSPTIPMGEADVLLALEWAEGLRWLPFLNPRRGTFIADTQRIVPPFACRDRRYGAVPGYARESVRDVLARVPNSLALDAAGIARELGNERVANTVLLGALSTALDFATQEWRDTIERFVPPATREVNLAAFDRGRDWALDAPAAPEDAPLAVPAGAPETALRVRLAIDEAWCKGCDICVKVCPERCLRLNERQIAELTAEDACTGCHLCEWLCPDYAITVHVDEVA